MSRQPLTASSEKYSLHSFTMFKFVKGQMATESIHFLILLVPLDGEKDQFNRIPFRFVGEIEDWSHS